MWAIRRASIHLKNRGLSSGTTRICCVKSKIASFGLENYNAGIIESQAKVLDAFVCSGRFYNTSISSKSCTEIRTYTSQAGAKSSGQQDDALEDAFSELESPQDAVQEAASGDEMDDDIQNELEIDTESDSGEKKYPPSAMTKAILANPALPASNILDKWVQAGNEVTQEEVSHTMFYLRKRKMYVKALRLSEWLESRKHLEFTENHYASRTNLIAKVCGIFKAEEYIEQIPESFRGERVYRTLLTNYVSAKNTKKSEELFNKMKNLFPLTCFSCDQLLLLYKWSNREKIADVLSLMEKENIKPSMFTYQILIDVKGQSNDISGMEQIIEKMKSDGMTPTIQIQASLARRCIACGLNDKAEAVLKEMEGGDITKKRWACQFLLPIYASLGRDDEVERIWKVCESNPKPAECMAAIEAWGQLKRIEDAEAVFEKLLKIVSRPSSKHFAILLNVYANHKMLVQGENLVKRMAESGVIVVPLAWDAQVKLYAGAGEVEKAVSILKKARKQQRLKLRPMFSSYLTVLDEYAKRGDIHNAEKIFLMMKQVGYPVGIQSYQSLLYAYINAKAPAYGFNDRMKSDRVVPNEKLAALLARADAFRKSPVAELLE